MPLHGLIGGSKVNISKLGGIDKVIEECCEASSCRCRRQRPPVAPRGTGGPSAAVRETLAAAGDVIIAVFVAGKLKAVLVAKPVWLVCPPVARVKGDNRGGARRVCVNRSAVWATRREEEVSEATALVKNPLPLDRLISAGDCINVRPIDTDVVSECRSRGAGWERSEGPLSAHCSARRVGLGVGDGLRVRHAEEVIFQRVLTVDVYVKRGRW